MTFGEMFQKAQALLDKVSVANVTEHIAIQVNVSGEGEGIFYIEIANGACYVEPYDYVDHDAVLCVDSQQLLTALENADTQALSMEGDSEKIAAFRTILATLPGKKKTVSKKTTTKSTTKTETKTTTKTTVKKETPKASALKSTTAAKATTATKAEEPKTETTCKTTTSRKCTKTKK